MAIARAFSALLALAVATTVVPTPASAADAKNEDVFLDDGSTDDFGEPIPTQDVPIKPPAPEASAPAVPNVPTKEEDAANMAEAIKNKAAQKGKKAEKKAKGAAKAAKAKVEAEATKAAAEAEKRAEEAAGPIEGGETAASPAPAPAEDAAPAPEAPKGKRAKTASSKAGAGKGQFKTTKAECAMHAEPSADSAKLTDLSAGKKIWVERAGDGWFKAFRRKGFGYVPAECF